jgi:hypothetical protein
MSLFEEASLVITPNGFKAGKLYAVKGADLDVTRATGANRINPSGANETMGANVPRIDYTSGGCPSILVEPQRTNLAIRSQEFDNAVWQLFNSSTVLPNNTISPDGTQNGDTINFSVNNESLLFQNISLGLNTYTLSLYAKSSTNKKFKFRNFTGTTVILSSEFQTTNEWQKFTYTFTDSLLNIGIMNEIAGGAGSIDVYGAQLEAGSYATSYIPTTSAIVTRNADVISKTGISSLIGQTEGTVFLNVNVKNLESYTRRILTLSDNTVDNVIGLQISSNLKKIVFFVEKLGLNQTVIATTDNFFNLNENVKIAVAYKLNDFALYVNGTQIGIDTSGTIPSTSVLKFSEANDSAFYTGNINTTALWKTRLTNAQLAELTTL